ncbi:MAG: hypothetical protein MJ126_06465 [Lachnospiraceae bacterium]|nr:hypothetical protein [Lachnospiraceae bacterium]
MGMIIAHNLMAMNADNQYNKVNKKQAKSTEKLSSGFKINRAADDAAGLAISEKMRRQIRGLDRAKFNIDEGISLCQTRDGALGEVHEMLQRMNELSVQAANGTLSQQDRAFLQVEVNQIASEINRIGESTTYNEIPIFDYKEMITIPEQEVKLVQSEAIGTGYMTEAYKYGENQYAPAANLDFSAINKYSVSGLYGKSFSFTCSASCPEAFKFTFIDGNGSSDSATNLSGQVEHRYQIDIHGLKTGEQVLDKLYSVVKNNMPNRYTPDSSGSLLVSHSNRMIRTSPTSMAIASTSTYPTPEQAKNIFKSSSSPYGKANCSELGSAIIGEQQLAALAIQAGSEKDQVIYVEMEKMNAVEIGVDPLDISTEESARNSIGKVKGAIDIISGQRSAAGADQNRLEHAYRINDNVVENTTASESQIRDTDMAKEMVQNSIQNILLQSGVAMMAQANQSGQQVLSLLNN